jgi:hypothetical protein
MTRDEYKRLVLQSANEAGDLDPPRLTSWFLMQEILVEMEIQDRTIKMVPSRSDPMRWVITDAGRALLMGETHSQT